MVPERLADGVELYQGDALQVMAELPDESVSAIVTDPPYFGVKADEWDNQWETADDFLAWMRSLCHEWQRLLKPNGSLYVFASAEMSGQVECVVGERFQVLNRICWVKTGGWHRRQDKSELRGYCSQTEYVLFAEHRGEGGGAFADYLRAEFQRAGVNSRGIAALFPSVSGGLTGCVSNWLLGYNLPTAEQYEAMRARLNRGGSEYLRREYDDLRRPFTTDESRPYTDVWEYPTVNTYPGKHPCEKPLWMFRDILRTSTRPGDTVLDCFAGSGTLGHAAILEGRSAVLVERDETYCRTIRSRVLHADCRAAGTLFAEAV